MRSLGGKRKLNPSFFSKVVSSLNVYDVVILAPLWWSSVKWRKCVSVSTCVYPRCRTSVKFIVLGDKFVVLGCSAIVFVVLMMCL